MRLICDSAKRRFFLPGCNNEIIRECLIELNASVNIPQIINLPYRDIEAGLKDCNVYFGKGEGAGIITAVNGAVDSVLKQIKAQDVHCAVLLLLCGLKIEISGVNDAVSRLVKRLPEVSINFGLKIEEAFYGYSRAYLIVSEICRN